MDSKTNVIILGAAGRDFHDFNVYWKKSPANVVCFTATQIPDIDNRKYPAELAGEKYPEGIPILSEADLPALIKKHNVKMCELAYSDLSYKTVGNIASRVMAAGSHFMMLSPHDTMIPSKKPVIAICAVRTGCGKSQTTRFVCDYLKKQGLKVGVLRHPMPYGDLVAQRSMRFETREDMFRHKCTIEEMEEFELHIEQGNLLYCGVDYGLMLEQIEKECDVVIWDGGNNDTSFYKADLYLTVVDPLRPGHEVSYYPGENNTRLADVVIVNKIKQAKGEDLKTVLANVKSVNPSARTVMCDSALDGIVPADSKANAVNMVKGKKVLCIEDGPTCTHGGMDIGAGYVWAQQAGAGQIIDPRPFAVGTIKATFQKYPGTTKVLPAMGYGDQQIKDLQATIDASNADVVVFGTPIALDKLIKINKPAIRVTYRLAPDAQNTKMLEDELAKFVQTHCKK